MPLPTCKVSVVDLQGVEHTVEVTAGSVYEAIPSDRIFPSAGISSGACIVGPSRVDRIGVVNGVKEIVLLA